MSYMDIEEIIDRAEREMDVYRQRICELEEKLAAATKYSEQQRQVIADTWDAALLYYMNGGNPLSGVAKETHINNLFPSEIKGEQQTK